MFLGLAAAGTRPPFGPNPVNVLISLGAFALGAVLAMPILRWFDGDQEIEDKNVFRICPRRVSITLGVASAVQIGFLVVWTTARPSAKVTYSLLGLGAFALGLQMNAARSLHQPQSVIAVTDVVDGAPADPGEALRPNRRRRRLASHKPPGQSPSPWVIAAASRSSRAAPRVSMRPSGRTALPERPSRR